MSVHKPKQSDHPDALQRRTNILVIAIPDHFRNPGISGLKTRNPGIGNFN
jgi:hypothetical protein